MGQASPGHATVMPGDEPAGIRHRLRSLAGKSPIVSDLKSDQVGHKVQCLLMKSIFRSFVYIFKSSVYINKSSEYINRTFVFTLCAGQMDFKHRDTGFQVRPCWGLRPASSRPVCRVGRFPDACGRLMPRPRRGLPWELAACWAWMDGVMCGGGSACVVRDGN